MATVLLAQAAIAGSNAAVAFAASFLAAACLVEGTVPSDWLARACAVGQAPAPTRTQPLQLTRGRRKLPTQPARLHFGERRLLCSSSAVDPVAPPSPQRSPGRAFWRSGKSKKLQLPHLPHLVGPHLS
jgi:hypothetical protein